VITLEDWAEVRRLHRAEGVPIKEIARRLGLARNTVRSALRAEGPPTRERGPRGSLVDAYEPRIRALLNEFPAMRATVIAERIGWPYSLTVLKDRVRVLRPQYAGLDPADRTTYEPGQITQCDLWFPATAVPVGHGQRRVLPVLVMTCGFSRYLSAVMIPSRQGGDILSGTWRLVQALGAVTRTLVWDRESAIGGTGRVSQAMAGFAGTLGAGVRLAPARDPEFKGMVERNNGYFETSFLPGRTFTGPGDFNAQIASWLTHKANVRQVRSTGGRPVDLLAAELPAMLALGSIAPPTGLRARTRLGRDYYVRVDGCDYSVDPRVIGRFVDVTATLDTVTVRCGDQTVAVHARCWAKARTVTDPAHQEIAADLRRALAVDRERRASRRAHPDGHPVALRALPDYDALFGVDFDPTPSHQPFTDGPEGAEEA
jgi:transposase